MCSPLAAFAANRLNEAPFARVVWTVYNRTGGATVVGGCYQFDTRLTTTAEAAQNSRGEFLPAVSDYSRGKNGAFGNIITVQEVSAASGTDAKPGAAHKYCLALEAKADNEPLQVLVVGTYSYGLLNCSNSNAGATLSWTSQPWSRLYPVSQKAGMTCGVGNETASGSYNLDQRSPVAINLASFSLTAAATATYSANVGSIFFDGWNFVSNKV